MKTFYTADTHFRHSNIIRYTNRPFSNVNTMDEMLIRNWNRVVKEHDFVIHLGDFAFKGSKKAKEYLSRLNGHITIIKGNHDRGSSVNTKILDLVVETGGQRIYCTHNPQNYNEQFKINLVAHVHDKWEVKKIDKTYLVNVGVDVWDYTPVGITKILRRLKEWKEK